MVKHTQTIRRQFADELLDERVKPNIPACLTTQLGEISKALDTHSRKYENTLIMGDFNVEPDNTNVKAFCNQYKLEALNKEVTCFENVDKPSCIDLFLTNSSKCFENCLTLYKGLSDFHKTIVTIMKTKHERSPSKTIKYRDYKLSYNAHNQI